NRDALLVHSSPPLEQDPEVTGPVKVVLYASSDAPDTDFVAKLVDVYPDGASYNIAEGVVRARHRDAVAGTRGRFRVPVTTIHFPSFDRNPNTGATFGTTNDVRVAEQTIVHDAEHPSHI